MTTMPIYALVDTWNAGATTFKGISLDVTDTASAAGSMLIDLQVGGVSRFSVTKAGVITGTLTNATGLPVSGITSSTSAALGVGSLELGHASDTTLSRISAGVLAVEGVAVPTISSTSELTNKTLTSPTFSGTIAGSPICSGSIWTWRTDTSFAPQLILENTATDAFGPYIIIGKLPSDNSLSANDNLGTLIFRGKDTGGASRDSILISCPVVTQSATNVKSKLVFASSQSTPGDSDELVINGGIILGNPTGGAQGVGTLNATAVYDDGVLLTCYVLEHWIDGTIDVNAWDARVPNKEIPAVVVDGEEIESARTEIRQHLPARGFAQVADARLDIDQFSQFLTDNRRLPAFPGPDRWADMFNGKMSTGDVLQRLWETVEIMAVLACKSRERELLLERRISALEAQPPAV